MIWLGLGLRLFFFWFGRQVHPFKLFFFVGLFYVQSYHPHHHHPMNVLLFYGVREAVKSVILEFVCSI